MEIHPDYYETFSRCVMALKLVYENDPISTLQSDEYKHYNHGIKKLIKSQIDVVDVNYTICDCSTEFKNKLLVIFGTTQCSIKCYQKIFY